MYLQGIETVRRDNCELVRKMVATSLDKILIRLPFFTLRCACSLDLLAHLVLFVSQGIETVRRDNCELVRKMVATSLDKILIERDETGAIEYVKGVIRDLLMNKVDMSLLVVTKVRTLCVKQCNVADVPGCFEYMRVGV
jgi:DNA polymerase elongation subunit (family B)